MLTIEKFHGFDCHKFDFEDTHGYVAVPKGKPNGRMVFKTEYWNAFPELEIEMLERKFHVVHMKTKTRLANKEDCTMKSRFVEFVSKKYSLNPKCILLGMSCGGAQAINFAAYYPHYTAGLVIDAPVLNFLDFPGKYNKYENFWDSEFKVAYPGVKRSDIFKLEENPINNVPQIIENQFPVIMLYGTQDSTVDYLLNGRLLEEAYEECKELLTVIPRESQGHHPHGLLGKSSELAEMVITKML